jgi:small subunit ribosomal protein S9
MAASNQVQEFMATGRRKTSVARVRLMHGVGKRQINGEDMEVYFPTAALRSYIEQPLAAVQAAKQYDVVAKIRGGGKVGQAGALRHGIARALVDADDAQKQALKDGGFLTRDSRMKERKKPGQPGARKRFQFSKR